MVLSDRTIERLLGEGRIEIDPYDPTLLQPSSVDVRVDRYFRVFRNSLYPYIDVKQEQEGLTELVEIDDEPFILHPGEFVLGSTLERVRLPDDLVARLEAMDGSTNDVDPVLTELEADVQHHVEEEESEAFPKFRSAVDQETLQTLADQVRELKEQRSA